MSIYVVAALTAKPGAAEQLREACCSLSTAVRAESGCLAHDFYVSASDGSFLYLEQWASSAAYDEHLGGPVVTRWSEITDGLIADITIDVIYPERVERL